MFNKVRNICDLYIYNYQLFQFISHIFKKAFKAVIKASDIIKQRHFTISFNQIYKMPKVMNLLIASLVAYNSLQVVIGCSIEIFKYVIKVRAMSYR